MKFTRISLTLVFLIFAFASFAQINEAIKEKSKQNQSTRNNFKNYSDDEYYNSDLDIGACCDGCLFTFDFGTLFVEALAGAQQKTLSKKDSIKRISSFEAGFRGGQASLWNWSVVPEIILTNGIFTTELRMYQSFEVHVDGEENYSTFDWQLLNFNLVNTKEATWRIGTGFMHENFSGEVFHESTMKLQFYPFDRWQFGFNFRFAKDYTTKTNVRQELNANIGYTIYENETTMNFNILKYTHEND